MAGDRPVGKLHVGENGIMVAQELRDVDVCVIGGGPAGAVAALRLARLGHAVCLVERQRFPRPHIGESLPPSILPLLELLGLRDRIEAAGFLRPQRAIVHWAGNEPFQKLADDEPGFQVDRGRFDSILLDAAARSGVRIIQPGLARRPGKDATGRWRIPVATRERNVSLQARFVIDAAGRPSLLGGPSTVQSPPTIALFGYWQSHGITGPETRVEAGRNHWYWGAPLPDGSFNATVFLDSKSRPVRSKSALERAYCRLIAESRLLRPCLSGHLMAPVQACDATCRCAVDAIGPEWLKVGESAFSIDPLSSQGVQTAVRTALQAAVVVHTILSTPQNATAAAQFYRDRQRESVTWNQQISAQLYAERAEFQSAPFWNKRLAARDLLKGKVTSATHPLPAPDSVICLADDARIELAPVIDGDLIVRRPALVHWRLRRPVAYLHGIAINVLLTPLRQPQKASDLILHWARLLPSDALIEMLQWMWNHQVIVTSREHD